MVPGDLYRADYVIACDKGWQYAKQMGITPDLIVGDFDSSPPPITDVPIEFLPVQKDDTDTMHAARCALERGYRSILICCAFGGRLDHTLANIQTASFLVSHGARVQIKGAGCDMLAFANATERFPQRNGWSLSVFALSDICRNVSIRGTKYVCENVTLTNTFPVGVSNAWASETAEISVGSGILLVVQSKMTELHESS